MLFRRHRLVSSIPFTSALFSTRGGTVWTPRHASVTSTQWAGCNQGPTCRSSNLCVNQVTVLKPHLAHYKSRVFLPVTDSHCVVLINVNTWKCDRCFRERWTLKITTRTPCTLSHLLLWRFIYLKFTCWRSCRRKRKQNKSVQELSLLSVIYINENSPRSGCAEEEHRGHMKTISDFEVKFRTFSQKFQTTNTEMYGPKVTNQ